MNTQEAKRDVNCDADPPVSPEAYDHPPPVQVDAARQGVHLPTEQLCRRRTVIEESFWGEMLLYCPESESAFTLNGSAKAIWELCDGKHTIIAISEELGQRFGCPCEELLPDILAALDQFRTFGLLELEAAPRTSSL
jgi:hypothetical protein